MDVQSKEFGTFTNFVLDVAYGYCVGDALLGSIKQVKLDCIFALDFLSR